MPFKTYDWTVTRDANKICSKCFKNNTWRLALWVVHSENHIAYRLCKGHASEKTSWNKREQRFNHFLHNNAIAAIGQDEGMATCGSLDLLRLSLDLTKFGGQICVLVLLELSWLHFSLCLYDAAWKLKVWTFCGSSPTISAGKWSRMALLVADPWPKSWKRFVQKPA